MFRVGEKGLATRLPRLPPGRLDVSHLAQGTPHRVPPGFVAKMQEYREFGSLGLSSDRRRYGGGSAGWLGELDAGTEEAGAESGHRVEIGRVGVADSVVSEFGGY